MGPDQKEFPLRNHARRYGDIACVASITGAQIMLAARGTSAVMNGLLGTAMGVSTLVGSLLANKLVDMVPTGRLIAGALALFAVSQMPLLFLHSYAAILICQILAGLPFPALNAGLLGFLYGKTPDNMQGRASAVFETTVGILGADCPGRGRLAAATAGSWLHGGDGHGCGLCHGWTGRCIDWSAASDLDPRPVERIRAVNAANAYSAPGCRCGTYSTVSRRTHSC